MKRVDEANKKLYCITTTVDKLQVIVDGILKVSIPQYL